MTGTVDSSTTLRISPAPPRGISTSTRPRARISALTLSWVSPGTSWTTSAGRPRRATASRSAADDRGVARPGAGGAAQQHGVAGLQADPGGVGGDVGAGLVDHPDHAERHPHLAQLEPVGQRRCRAPPRRPGRAGRRPRAARAPSPRAGRRSSRSRSTMLAGVPAASARATSSALAARISVDAATSSASAMACRAASLVARVAVASSWLAVRARVATSRTAVRRVLMLSSVGRASLGCRHVSHHGR